MDSAMNKAITVGVGIFITLIIVTGVFAVITQINNIYAQVYNLDTNLNSRFDEFTKYDNADKTGVDMINAANKFYNENLNMNKIKAILHNKVLLNMVNKNYPYDKIIVDEFTPARNYYGYLTEVKDKVTNITFVQKAESKCLSVAVSSIIARYIFLKLIHEMSTELGSDIPKGAGLQVDEFARKIVKEKGMNALSKYVKLNFKNTNKIRE